MKFKIGQTVELTFLDHAQGMEVIECTLIGKVVKSDKKFVVLRSWHCHGRDDEDNNHEQFSVIKSTILHGRVLR